MSFPIICLSCGAPSAPSVGICPFCKSVQSVKKVSPTDATLNSIGRLYVDGKLDQVLVLTRAAEKSNAKLLKNPKFALLYAKILIEADGPSSKIRSLLAHALLDDPENQDCIEYMEVIEAKSNFSREISDLGELALQNIIRRSPKNVHALFLLGSHLFWVQGETQKSLLYLEQCVRLRPNFLRALACLGAIYKKVGQQQATRVFKRCAVLENNNEMKAYFQKLAVS